MALSGANRAARIQFKILAIRGAAALAKADASGLHAWLEALRLAGDNFDFHLVGIEQNNDGSEGAHHYAATIQRPCETSAKLCSEHESRVLEAELRKKRVNTTGDAPRKTKKTYEPEFPDRAVWLRQRLVERSWNKHDISRKGGPDHKTVQKMLDGRPTREDMLDKLVRVLSDVPLSKKLPPVNLLDIPQS